MKIWLECCWLLVLCSVDDPVVDSLGAMCAMKYQQGQGMGSWAKRLEPCFGRMFLGAATEEMQTGNNIQMTFNVVQMVQDAGTSCLVLLHNLETLL